MPADQRSGSANESLSAGDLLRSSPSPCVEVWVMRLQGPRCYGGTWWNFRLLCSVSVWDWKRFEPRIPLVLLVLSMSLLRVTENTISASVTPGLFIISVSQPSGLLLTAFSNHFLFSQKSVPEPSSRLKMCVLNMSGICGEGGKEAGRGKSFCSSSGWLIFSTLSSCYSTALSENTKGLQIPADGLSFEKVQQQTI